MARQERERRYSAEWLAEFGTPGCYMTNVPLGNIPEEIVAMHGITRGGAIFRPSRRRIDAVAWDGPTYDLIEFKIRDPFEGLSRLPTYLALAKRAQDLPHYTDQPFRMVLVTPFALDWIRQAAQDMDIKLVVWFVDWIGDYIREYQLYYTEEYRAKRDEVKRAREALGLE